MANPPSPDIASFLPALLVLLQNIVGTMFGPEGAAALQEGKLAPSIKQIHSPIMSMHTIVSFFLHDFRISQACALMGADLNHCVLPRSTTWFF
jgi:hypothetical protein